MTPTETTAPRLIDANAIKEAMLEEMDGKKPYNEDWLNGMANAFALMESAPTVETTDDVLSSLETLEKEMTLNYSNGEYSFKVIGSGYTSYSNSPFEALKKLEATLNQK